MAEKRMARSATAAPSKNLWKICNGNWRRKTMNVWSALKAWWCETFHPDRYWTLHSDDPNKVEAMCPDCRREWTISWAQYQREQRRRR
jgi:hypothetical protein